jgi:hypothetical protein
VPTASTQASPPEPKTQSVVGKAPGVSLSAGASVPGSGQDRRRRKIRKTQLAGPRAVAQADASGAAEIRAVPGKPSQAPLSVSKSADAVRVPAPGRFIWNEPPAGFGDLAQLETSVVDVFFHQEKLASIEASFAPGWIRFKNPREIVEKLPAGVDRGQVSEALSGELDTNSILLCSIPPPPNCGRLTPRVAGVIFDRDRFRVDLFINPALLPVQARPGPARLPPPETGLSALQSFAAVYSGGTISAEQYNVDSFTLLALNKSRLRAHTGVSDTDGFGIGTLVGEHERGDQIYRGGLYRSAPVPILGDRPFFGAGYISTYRARLDLDQIRGSELVIFLPRPAQVDVFREGRLIGSQSFQGGNQALDTSTFPAGAYDVLLRIKESGGGVREERRFFVKSDQVPPRNAPRYVVEAGILGGPNRDPFPETDTAPLLHAGTTHRILDEIAVGGDLVVSTETSGLSAEIYYLNPFVTVSVGGFGALDESVGVRFNANGRLKRFSYAAGVRYFATEPRSREISLTSLTGGGFTQFDGYLGYAFENGPRLGFRGFWRDSDVSPVTYSYGPTFHWTFFRRRAMNIALISDATFTNTESLAMARLRFSYDDRKYHFDASAGYRAALDSTTTTADGPLASANGEWRKQDVLDGEVRLGAGVETQPRADVTRANAKYIGPRGQINAFVQQDISRDYGTRYGGNLLFNVVGNSESVTMGGAYAYSSGVIVAVAGDAKADFEILVDGQPRGRVAAGQTLPVLLPDYKTYNIRLKAVGAPAIAYDTRMRRVSLYPGTVKTLRWFVQPVVTLFGRIVDADGRPIADSRVEGGVETSYTDGNGYFQVDVARETELRVVRRGWNKCAVRFRSLPRDKEFVSGRTLVCRYLTAEKEATRGGERSGAPAN